MRISGLLVLLVTFCGAASAGDLAEPRTYEANDYSAQVYYRLDFGGSSRQSQSLGLRFDNERVAAAGAPALLAANFGEQGLARLAVNGVDLRGAMLSSNQSADDGFFSNLTWAQWIALGFTAIVFGTVVSDAADSDPDVDGTGSGGG